MPEFSTPFNGNNCQKKLNKEELIRAIRFSIAAEYEAIQLYEQLRDSIDCPDSKKVLTEIANDEKVHAGNFLYLLKLLSPEEEERYKEGFMEAGVIIENKKD